ncbi:hypothetical protein KGF57_005014 [Candida theae]|uniref:Zn(2)-C6 fungal-type domain-containing protein n=1 Tax=Candida theae TaxID=1198502 RepID=A0AAD5BAJ9_9ASCO|nr:uncharacterized protein KGF57_005014 [Candida theae]KAI5948951.1 hypothetical protein KGF57_005014 [Candida theae]
MDPVRSPDYFPTGRSAEPLQESTTTLKRRRTRSGCVTCRDRHIKCDEAVPVCNNCLRSRRVCYRGLRLNFIQYTYYDPRKDSSTEKAGLETDLRHQPHRILDQSLSIAALYNGSEKYHPFLHLHSQQDLKDSDMDFRDENYLPLNDPTLSDLPSSHHSTKNSHTTPKRKQRGDNVTEASQPQSNQHMPFEEKSTKNMNKILSQSSSSYSNQSALSSQQSSLETPATSLTLTQQQSSQMLSYPTSNQVAASSLPYTGIGVQNTTAAVAYDHQYYISILVREQFFWLLDQFNDFNIWQTVIPVVCVKETDNFLFSCLMNCSQDPSISETIDLKFLVDFQTFKYNQVTEIELIQASNLSLFETLLISVCLVLLSIYLKIPNGKLTAFHKQVLNNQANLFDQLLAKLFIYFMHLGNGEKSLVISSCIQSITILKFFMNKYYDLAFIHHSTHIINPLDVDVSSFIKFNSYEINFLNSSYKTIDITSSETQRQHTVVTPQNINLAAPRHKQESRTNQHTYAIETTATTAVTESRKLKDLLWYLIKLDYVVNFPNEATQFSTHNNNENPVPDMSVPELTLTPNSRLITRAILRSFTFKLLNMNNGMIVQQSNLQIRQYFELSRQNGVDVGNQLYIHYFGWTLRYVNVN